METIVCPWCQTEIVWDEELGPEEECPHCQNELNEYRTINIGIDEDDEEFDPEETTPLQSPSSDEDTDEGIKSLEPFWERDVISATPVIRALDKYETSHDLMNYEEMVEKVLDEQEEVPECPHCHEYMLLAGQQQITDAGFQPNLVKALQSPVLSTPFTLDMYICSGCFHVQTTLSEEDRLRMVQVLSK